MTVVEHPNATIAASVEVPRVGTVQYELGFPTPETTQRLFDEMDFQRAVQCYLWAYPAVSFESIRVTAKESLGIDYNDWGIADNFVDPKSGWLTANDTTIYAFVNIDLTDEPVAIEIPPGAIVGLMDDFWQRSVTDVGLPGPDAGKGGTFLLVPPDYDGEVPASGYYVLHATMHNHNLLVRGIIPNKDEVAEAVERVRKTRVYPWSERDNPTPNKWVSISGALMDTTPPGGIEYWARLHAVIDNNPVEGHDRFFMAMLKPLGIEKGKPFEPDSRQTAILEEAAGLGDAMARNVMYEISSRTSDHFDGGKSYRLHVPANPPVSAFWSLTLYDSATRSMHQNPTNDAARSGYDELETNADGSFDLYFAPDVPDGQQASNWIETVPGRGYYPMFRFYSPTEPLFDGTWALPDVEPM